MGITYFKRYRMEADLAQLFGAAGKAGLPPLPSGYRLVAWSDTDVPTHAEAKYQSFRGELDAAVFPCLSTREGCLRLMQEICRKNGFIPEATWLLLFAPEDRPAEACGTIQGMLDHHQCGSIQNVGVVAAHRHRGLGSALVWAALDGFRRVGITRAVLEVTAQNTGAVRLYQRLGFRRARTNYKAVESAVS